MEKEVRRPARWDGRIVLLANVVLLMVSLLVGWRLYAGALGWSDSLAIFNPYPVCSLFPSPDDRVLDNPVAFITTWYQNVNGRLSVAVTNSLISLFSRACCPTPESFPWWLIRSLALFTIIAAPMNMVVAGVWRYGRRGVLACGLVLLVWAVWSINPATYGYTVWMDCLLIDRYGPMFVLSLAMLAMVNGWPRPDFWSWLGHGLVFLCLATIEQFMLVAPVLFLSFAWLSAPAAGRAAFIARRALVYLGLTAIAAAVYFASPGQALRIKTVPVNHRDEVSLIVWYQKAVEVAYGALIIDRPVPPNDGLYWTTRVGAEDKTGGISRVAAVHTMFVAIIVLAVLALMVRRVGMAPGVERENTDRAFGFGLLAISFLIAHLASTVSLLISPHFPPYVRNLPALLLAFGWVYGLALFREIGGIFLARCCRLVSCQERTKCAGALICVSIAALISIGGLAAIGWRLTIPAIQACRTSYVSGMRHDQLRQRLFTAIINDWQATGHTTYRIVNLSPSTEAPWAMSAYFRWRQAPIQAFIDGQPAPSNIVWTTFVWRGNSEGP